MTDDQKNRIADAADEYAKRNNAEFNDEYVRDMGTFIDGALWQKADEAKRVAGLLKTILTHLDNPATSQNEALCLIRRDIENAFHAFDTPHDTSPGSVAEIGE